MRSEEAVEELKVTKRIDANRVGRVLKQTRESMMEMDQTQLQSLVLQAEADLRRCADASEVLRLVSTQLADIMLIGIEVAEVRKIKIP